MEIKDLKIIKLRMDESGAESDQTNFFMSLSELTGKAYLLTNYVITPYQRPYSWDRKQILELMNDIWSLNSGSYHFTGVFYFGELITNHGSPIVDGQQRLTTIFLLCSCLFENEEFKKEMELLDESDNKRIKYNECYDLFKNCTLHLKVDNRYYRIIDSADNSTNSAENNNLLHDYRFSIKRAKGIIENRLKSDINYYEFMCNLFDRLFFLVIQCEDEKSELALFRIINSKGKHIDEIDKAKCLMIADFYKTDEETKRFIDLWTKINKQTNKKSLNVFFNGLIQKLNPKLKKFKYADFETEVAKKEKNVFLKIFEESVENFEWFSAEPTKIFCRSQCNQPKTWKNFQAMSYLCKLVLKNKLDSEVMNKFVEYKSGSRSSILLFSLFLFTYIVKSEYKFSGSEGDKLIERFLLMSEQERKSELKNLFAKFKSDNKLDEIQYKQKGVNDTTEKINSRHKCVLPMYILIKCNSNESYFDEIVRIVSANLKTIDHYIPKKEKPTRTSVKNHRNRLFSANFSTRAFSLEEKNKLNMVYNLAPMSPHCNLIKSSIMPENFIKKNEKEQIEGFDFNKINRWLENEKQNSLASLDNLITTLTQ